ncbi:hypothetical protein FAZ69_27975 [Trinickia terrae]|uniref:Uncharacterized protein n=1 Tax=Trinickia terrae TaxID=2571161 RepID=A0A4U1HJZ0_9BURK|nr:hypothetical protein [Trinickia terrae]TKC81462.1 hypothetical protein FAZ69_27975 [Trinickia terrae]
MQEQTSSGAPRAVHHPLGAPALLIGLLAAPLAWFVQIGIVEALAAQSCFAYDKPQLDGGLTANAWAGAVCLTIGLCGAAFALRNRRVAVATAREAGARSNHPLMRRVSFITGVSLMSTLLFLAGLVATDIAGLIVSPCGR